MATNRYGQIYHGDYHHINIRFPSTEARLKFQNEFEAYHQGHDHEGDIPTFISVSSKDLKLSTGSRSPQDLVKAETDENYRITIDGYSWNEIHEYHNPTGWKDSFWYSVPTCCVPPIIVIDYKFVDAGTLQRHELSAIFGDMPEQDYKSLLESVQRDGFIDDTIKLLDGQLLDGWHRYRAAQELNLIRKLRFQEWNEDDRKDGDPKAFVLARNIERRHLTPGQRAQIAVTFNERFGHGGDRNPEDESQRPDGRLKTQKDLAKEAGVGERTIRRAVQVETAGQSEAVISGEKSASEVLLEKNRKKAQETCVEMWKAFEKSPLSKYLDKDDFMEVAGKNYQCSESFPDPMNMKRPEIWVTLFTAMKLSLEKEAEWVKAWIDEFVADADSVDTKLAKIVDALPQWQETVEMHHIPDTVKDAVRTADPERVIAGAKRMGKVENIDEVTTAEVKAIVNLMKKSELTLYFCVHDVVFEAKSKSDTAETETEAASAVVKPRFQDAVETWRSSQVERLRKFEVLPVGRTPLIESEYLKTYFELAQPRIQQNTKPTAAHYEGAIECMLDLPVAFAEQLQGRHYRRIIKEWDQSVLLQLVERFQSGHIIGYPALQTDSDANAARIRKAIRDHYEFKARITTQPFEVLFEITEDAHAILVQLNPKEWIREGREISWALSLLSEVKGQPSEKSLPLQGAPAEAEPDMNALWDAFNKRYPKWKAKYAESGYKENDLIQASTEAEMLNALRVYRETESERKGKQPTGSLPYSPSDRKGMPTADEVKDMTDLMSQQSYPFARCLRDLLRAKGISDWTQQHQQTLESVQKFKERLREFGAPDDLVDDSLHFYQGIEETELSTRPQETLKQLNEFLQGFIEKPLPEWPEWIRNQVPEGDAALPGIDIHAMRNTLSSLLETLGIDDSNRNLQESLGGDLLDVFLQYEELPTAKEQLIALLNTADAILSEMIP